MQRESWPLRKGDMLFVVAAVMLAFALPSRAAAAMLVAGAVLAWIRGSVYGSRDQRNTPR
jgi:hypothetical protein